MTSNDEFKAKVLAALQTPIEEMSPEKQARIARYTKAIREHTAGLTTAEREARLARWSKAIRDHLENRRRREMIDTEPSPN